MTILDSLKQWFSSRNDWQVHQTSTPERESPRYNITFFVRYGGDGPLTERRGNIGIGGFCFEGEREYAVGSELQLGFFLPGTGHRIAARGEVLGQARYQRYLGIRGRFTAMSFDDERFLARWLDSMTRQIQGNAERQPVLMVSY